MGPLWGVDPTTDRTMSGRSTTELPLALLCTEIHMTHAWLFLNSLQILSLVVWLHNISKTLRIQLWHKLDENSKEIK